jgi:archaetidylinositol phosphate synthase
VDSCAASPYASRGLAGARGGGVPVDQDLTRVIDSRLAGAERRLIGVLVQRLPAAVSPDVLTAAGVFGAVVTFVGYAACAYADPFIWMASLGLVLHWFGDSLDGSLARHRRIERPRYGFFLDQNIDVLGNLLIAGGLAASPYIRWESAAICLIGYHMLSIYALVRAVVEREFHLTVFNSGPTEVRLLILVMNALIAVFGAPKWEIAGLTFTWADAVVSVFGIGMATTFVLLLVRHAPRLRAADDAERA